MGLRAGRGPAAAGGGRTGWQGFTAGGGDGVLGFASLQVEGLRLLFRGGYFLGWQFVFIESLSIK